MFTAGADFRFVSRVDNIDSIFVNLGIIPDGDQREDIIVTDVRAGPTFRSRGYHFRQRSRSTTFSSATTSS